MAGVQAQDELEIFVDGGDDVRRRCKGGRAELGGMGGGREGGEGCGGGDGQRTKNGGRRRRRRRPLASESDHPMRGKPLHRGHVTAQKQQ